MRSIRLLAATTLILFGAAACGDDNGGGTGINQDPTASFTGGPCTAGAACTFNDTSSDPEGANTITRREWNFGDGTAVVVDPGLTPSHTYQVAGDYTVTLTVTDNGNNTATATQTITVTTGTPTNAAPTANFTVPSCVVNVACLFTDTSTDTDGVVSAWSWTFGDGTAAVLEQNPSHTYAVEGNYNVELTVTDDDGATDIITQAVTVAPPAATQC